MAPPTTLFPSHEREAFLIREQTAASIPSSTVTATSATPAVFTPASMVFLNGQAVVLSSTVSVPGGFTAGVPYYVVNATATTFQLAATPGGSGLASTSTGTGTITALGVGVPIPVTTCKPSDKPIWIEDTSQQGHMGDISGIYQGPLIAGLDLGGHATLDVLPHLLWNLLGDYTVTGTAASPAGATSAALAQGATAITVASGGASFTVGMALWLQDAGSPALNEVVYVNGTATATNIPITATRYAHATGMPFTNTTAPYTHFFSVLNSGGGYIPANGAAQPVTHTWTDRTGIPASGLAAQYPYMCMSELTIVGNAEKLLDWTGKAVCMTRQIAAGPVYTTNVSAVQPYPSWRSITGIGGPASGGTQVKNIPEWSVTIARKLKAVNTDQGSQAPYVIARGEVTVTGKHTIGPAIDESTLIALLANTQPQLEYAASNGLTGSNLNSITLDVGLGAYQTSDLAEGDVLFGYEVPWKAPHTASSFTCTPFTGPLTGASGGKSAIKITVVNAVPTY